MGAAAEEVTEIDVVPEIASDAEPVTVGTAEEDAEAREELN